MGCFSSKTYTFVLNKHYDTMIELLVFLLIFTIFLGWVAYLILETGKWKYLLMLFTPFFLIAWYIGFCSCYISLNYDYYKSQKSFLTAKDSLYISIRDLEDVPEVDSVIKTNRFNPKVRRYLKARQKCKSGWSSYIGEAPCE